MTAFSTEIVLECLTSLSTLPHDANGEMRETVLVRDGFFFGRRFEYADLTAVWFAESEKFKVSDASGRVLLNCQVQEIASRYHSDKKKAA